MSSTVIVLLVLVALVTALRWAAVNVPDMLAARKLADRRYVGVQLVADADGAEKAMKEAWVELIRQHHGRSAVEWIYFYEGTADGTQMQVILGDRSEQLDNSKQVLADKHEGSLSFYRLADHPWAELHRQLHDDG